jgi:hypothetical protein
MLPFKQFLQEKLILISPSPYPKFGQIVIVGGGSSVGKGFVIDKLLGVEGKIFDVDELKELVLASTLIKERAKTEFGVDLNAIDLTNSKDVAKIHSLLIRDLKLASKQKRAFYTNVAVADLERKPNIIFDVTLSDFDRFETIAKTVSQLGYKKENVHIVWVINNFEIAKKQNEERSRKVSYSVLLRTHAGAFSTLKEIASMGSQLEHYMNGAIVCVFNKRDIDTVLKRSNLKGDGSFIEKATYFFMKKRGKQVTPFDELNDEMMKKILSYAPKNY